MSDNKYSTPPPISSMVSAPTPGKTTNVIMPNYQSAIMEYVSEPNIPKELQTVRPLESMLIIKRCLGNETELESAANDIEFDAISLFREVGGSELALDMSFSYLHHREGLRTHNGFERDHQVMSKTMETLETIEKARQSPGFLSKVGGFVKGADPQQLRGGIK